jgi:hypothetical protein
MSFISRRKCVLTIVAAATFCVPAFAQEQNIRTITFYKIKPDRIDDFMAALKDYKAVLVKANAPRPLQVYRRMVGEREFVLVSGRQKYGDFGVQNPAMKEVQGELNRVIARLDSCVSGSERILDERVADLSLPLGEPTKMIRSVRIRVRPERINDFIALMKSELMPAVKKSGVKTWVTYRTMYGSSRFEFRSSMGFNEWSDLDGVNPIVTAMGGTEAYNTKYIAKATPMLTFVEYSISQHMPDLSYTPKK